MPARLIRLKFEESDLLHAIALLLGALEDHALLPGTIESWLTVIDMRGANSDLNYPHLNEALRKVLLAYPMRFKEAYTIGINPSSELFKLFQATLIEHCRHCILLPTTIDDLNHTIPNDEREIKYGGSLLDLYEYWPIPSTSKIVEEKTVRFEDETEFHSCVNDVESFTEHKAMCEICCMY